MKLKSQKPKSQKPASQKPASAKKVAPKKALELVYPNQVAPWPVAPGAGTPIMASPKPTSSGADTPWWECQGPASPGQPSPKQVSQRPTSPGQVSQRPASPGQVSQRPTSPAGSDNSITSISETESISSTSSANDLIANLQEVADTQHLSQTLSSSEGKAASLSDSETASLSEGEAFSSSTTPNSAAPQSSNLDGSSLGNGSTPATQSLLNRRIHIKSKTVSWAPGIASGGASEGTLGNMQKASNPTSVTPGSTSAQSTGRSPQLALGSTLGNMQKASSPTSVTPGPTSAQSTGRSRLSSGGTLGNMQEATPYLTQYNNPRRARRNKKYAQPQPKGLISYIYSLEKSSQKNTVYWIDETYLFGNLYTDTGESTSTSQVSQKGHRSAKAYHDTSIAPKNANLEECRNFIELKAHYLIEALTKHLGATVHVASQATNDESKTPPHIDNLIANNPDVQYVSAANVSGCLQFLQLESKEHIMLGSYTTPKGKKPTGSKSMAPTSHVLKELQDYGKAKRMPIQTSISRPEGLPLPFYATDPKTALEDFQKVIAPTLAAQHRR